MSNVHKFSNRSTIEAEAREWLIRLDGDTSLTDEETAALQEWAGRSPAHCQELKRISRFWHNANILTELAIPLHGNRNRGRFTGFFAGYRLAAVAAVLLIAIGIAFTTWNQLPEPDPTSNGIYGTTIGQQRIVVLPDGSTIELNTDSQAQVDYGPSVRKIRLLRGESMFEVAHDPDKPFEVYAGGNMVRAVGTAFSVQLTGGIVKVTVAEGKVELAKVKNPQTASGNDNDGRDIQLAPERLGFLEHGQSATLGNTISQLHTLAQKELDQQLSWRDGFLTFSGEPLKDVVREINRYTPVTIEIADPALEALKVGGRFRVNDLDAMLEVLETSFNIRVSRIGDQRILLRAAAAPSG